MTDFGAIEENGNDNGKGLRERVYVPQPSPDQAGSGWGTQSLIGSRETHISESRCGAPGFVVGCYFTLRMVQRSEARLVLVR
jgi:hypothetical protein